MASRSRRGVLWTHNDSGDSPRLFALSTTGRLLDEVTLPGAENVDWEDIAARDGDLYVGDIGDNNGERDEISVYRLPESDPSAVRRLALRYPDKPHDAEALLVDPSSGELVLVTKTFGGDGRAYVAPPDGGTLRRGPRVAVAAGEAVTAGDVSGDGRTIVLRTYDRALVWTRRRGESVAEALGRQPCAAATAGLSEEGQGETLALAADGRSFFTVPEGSRPLLRRYSS